MQENLTLQTNSLINYDEALNRMGGDETFLSELINDYITDFNHYFLKIKFAIEDDDFSEISLIGHTLKGSSAMLSLITISLISSQMEIAGVEKNIFSAKRLLLELKNEFEKLMDLFSKIKLIQLN
ncbi:MAG: Hpt domain-containing protein [Candidatus Aminicenantes bacterium]|nr:Hpt domain-containing protein [Candidatus Aminicenantes bacterium]